MDGDFRSHDQLTGLGVVNDHGARFSLILQSVRWIDNFFFPGGKDHDWSRNNSLGVESTLIWILTLYPNYLRGVWKSLQRNEIN